MEVTADASGWSFGNPYRPADELTWCALMFEAFGTRQSGVADVFINHLARLCSSQWDEKARAWRPNEQELQTAIALVQSLAPRNEAEAALAAQAVAVHFATMKLAHNLAGRSNPDARTLASLAALAKAYVKQLEAMQQLKGRKVSRQKITVRNERHVHHHQHVHVEGGGSEIGGQACEPSDSRNGGNNRGAASVEHERCAALPGPDASGVVVPMSRYEGQEPVPDPRWGEGLGSAKG